VQVTYESSEKTHTHDVNTEDLVVDCLTDVQGSFFYLPLNDQATSQYSGLHVLWPNDDGWDVMKSLYDFGDSLFKESEFVFKNLDENTTTLHQEQGKVMYGMKNGIFTVRTHTREIPLRFDCRKVYDYSSVGRIYNISQVDNQTIIEYIKYSDASLRDEEYRTYVVIRCDEPMKIVENWEPVVHRHDDARGTHPRHWFVFHAVTLPHNCTAYISVGKTLQEASGKFLNANPKKQTQLKHTDVAYLCAYKSLQSLTVNYGTETGLFAGLPWFFHWWTRDEAICLGALIDDEQYALVKQIFLRQFSRMKNGRVPNRFPHADLGSADGTGWLFFQVGQVLRKLKQDNQVHKHFSATDLRHLLHWAEDAIMNTMHHHMDEDLVHANKDETWMDTSFGDDIRFGYCIEIQALFLATCKTYFLLVDLLRHAHDNETIMQQYHQTLSKVQQFFDGGIIKDRIDDATIRPNMFIAAYVCPDMFTNKQWKQAIDAALDALWSEGVGVTSISRDHPLFCGVYTPQDNLSYHRGDVWYWINHLAALVMLEVDRSAYAKQIKAIESISRKELLTKGALGHCAEVSSALHSESQGCPMQAWSASTYLQLLSSMLRHESF